MFVLKSTIMGTKMVWVKNKYMDYIDHGMVRLEWATIIGVKVHNIYND